MYIHIAGFTCDGEQTECTVLFNLLCIGLLCEFDVLNCVFGWFVLF